MDVALVMSNDSDLQTPVMMAEKEGVTVVTNDHDSNTVTTSIGGPWAMGSGTPTTALAAVTPILEPGHTSIIVSWEPPADNGSDITHYPMMNKSPIPSRTAMMSFRVGSRTAKLAGTRGIRWTTMSGHHTCWRDRDRNQLPYRVAGW